MTTPSSNPFSPTAAELLHQGLEEKQAGRPAAAVESLVRAVQLAPGHVQVHHHLAMCYRMLRQFDRAEEHFHQVVRLSPDFAPGYNNWGTALAQTGRLAEAVEAFTKAVRLSPQDPGAHGNLAMALLCLGEYEKGWIEYEWRYRTGQVTKQYNQIPEWQGMPLPQGSILLWAEQGFGDTLQFIRYAAQVKQRVGTVFLACQESMRGLLADCAGIDRVLQQGAPLPPLDAQASLMCLPRIFGTRLDNIPAAVPYLSVDAARRQHWQARMGSHSGFRVGIVWQGQPKYGQDPDRSVRLEQFRPLSAVPGVQLFSLQVGTGNEQLAALAEPFPLTDLSKDISADFRDTAAVVSNLDLVISVDTSVAHLAGALGVPVWILLPFAADWRWLLDREDSPWYPTARLFRQPRRGEWDSVFKQAIETLRQQIDTEMVESTASETHNPTRTTQERTTLIGLPGNALPFEITLHYIDREAGEKLVTVKCNAVPRVGEVVIPPWGSLRLVVSLVAHRFEKSADKEDVLTTEVFLREPTADEQSYFELLIGSRPFNNERDAFTG